MFSPSTGTLALHPPAPFPPTPLMGFRGLVWDLWDTRVLSPPLGAPSVGTGVLSRPGQGPRSGAGMRAAVGVGGRTGVSFSFSPLAGFYESLRQDLK